MSDLREVTITITADAARRAITWIGRHPTPEVGQSAINEIQYQCGAITTDKGQ